ncbi:MAG TPA: GntP family permease [Flavitalea sp.]|nr:GntP family permease [Flavitalea sp.]
MTNSFLQVSLCLVAGILLIVILTARFRIPAFFALFVACFVVGLGVELPVTSVIEIMKDGFGNIMRSLAFIIVIGTALGVILEFTRSTQVIASFILRKTGDRHAPLAMSITGFVVGLPIFCDSGYIVMSGVNNSLQRKTGIPMPVMAISLATGLYSVHCLLPPHPGAAAAAALLKVDYGKLILTGLLVALPAMMAGNWWAKRMGRRVQSKEEMPPDEKSASNQELPSTGKAFLPVVVPILLIAIRSFFLNSPSLLDNLKPALILGEPIIALSIGLLLALNCKRAWKKNEIGKLLQEAAEKAGGILVIIGAGGAFGAILAVTRIGHHFSEAVSLEHFGIFFPFLLTAILKTAQGSSTVAIITASSIVLPLLPSLGLTSENGALLTVLSMGAGSMMISHSNDAYFWVIAKFSGLEMKTMLKVYSLASIIMGVISILMIYFISLITGY